MWAKVSVVENILANSIIVSHSNMRKRHVTNCMMVQFGCFMKSIEVNKSDATTSRVKFHGFAISYISMFVE